MKTILFLVFCLLSVFASATFCKKDNLYATQCELVEGSQAIELVTIRNACAQTRGEKPVDCFFVKTCDKKTDEVRSSMMAHNTPAHMDTLCDDVKNGKVSFFNSHEDKKKSFKASILCDDKKKPLAVELESPKGVKKTCPVFFFKKTS